MTPHRLPLAAAILAAVTARAATVDVTTCGQTIPAGGKGILQTDLVCSTDYSAINLGPGARLNLNGHTITGGSSGVVGDGGGRYVVSGPGTITASADYCVIVVAGLNEVRRAHGKLRDVTLRGCGLGGASARDRLDLVRVTIEDIVYTSEGFGNGAVASDVRARDSAIARTVVGIRAFTVAKVHDTIVQDGRIGIRVDTGRLIGTGLNVTGNTSWGIRVGNPDFTDTSSLYLKASTVTGNLYDLASPTLPRLVATTCGRSAQPQFGGNFGPSWSVCQND